MPAPQRTSTWSSRYALPLQVQLGLGVSRAHGGFSKGRTGGTQGWAVLEAPPCAPASPLPCPISPSALPSLCLHTLTLCSLLRGQNWGARGGEVAGGSDIGPQAAPTALSVIYKGILIFIVTPGTTASLTMGTEGGTSLRPQVELRGAVKGPQKGSGKGGS